MLHKCLVLLFIISFSSCQGKMGSGSEKHVDTNWQLTISDGINIHHPSDWVVDLSGIDQTLFILHKPLSQGDDFAESISLSKHPTPIEGLSVKELGILFSNQVTQLYQTSTIIEHRLVK
ncbi:MAG: hypothetical protein HKN16_04745, partial [Saprospiraceae bacterium]|nr:hypothetical protein [Saprospiraceae bacterium]